ncbi:MAG: CopG family transcriptional regulator [Chloroflexota bacterium]
MKKRTTIILPEQDAKILTLEAQRRGISASHMVREAVAAYIAGPAMTRHAPAFVGLVDSGFPHTDGARAKDMLRDRAAQTEEDAFGGTR